jgi:hypothetical protein
MAQRKPAGSKEPALHAMELERIDAGRVGACRAEALRTRRVDAWRPSASAGSVATRRYAPTGIGPARTATGAESVRLTYRDAK